MGSPHPSVATGVFKKPFPEQVAYFRGKLGNLVPTARWDDMTKEAHDLGFMVAGAAKADLLTDLAAACDRAVSEGTSLEAFRKDFMATIERRGWAGFTGDESPARRAWRTRLIYSTNCTTSYNAGRNAQLAAAGFPLLVYRHNDSVANPRPHHLAWNGLTLPKDDPFWQAHKPQNGWGCRCYILGARSERGARRLGGEPGKEPPGGWDEIDPKTGELVGIDPGWGYSPGESVKAEVSKMAEKTRQWEYTLAKNYMQGVPERQRDALATAYRALPSVAGDVRRYAQRIIEGRTHLDIPPYQTMGLLTSADAEAVKGLIGKDVAMFDYALDQYAPLHIKDNHGDEETEERRGQRAVTADDYARLPLIVDAPDRVSEEDGALLFEKIFGGERYFAVFTVLEKRKTLNLKTVWIRR